MKNNNQKDQTNHQSLENNKVTVIGTIASGFEYNHELHGEKFYDVLLQTTRLSDTVDVLPVMVSERLIEITDEWAGRQVKIEGQFRSFNDRSKEKNRLILYIFARGFEECEHDEKDIDIFSFNGYVCKEPRLRETPLGRKICDMLVAINRPYGKSDYIPTICWNLNANFASKLQPGDHIKGQGRIQSRVYLKNVGENETEEKTAYEVSLSAIELVNDEEVVDENTDAVEEQENQDNAEE